MCFEFNNSMASPSMNEVYKYISITKGVGRCHNLSIRYDDDWWEGEYGGLFIDND